MPPGLIPAASSKQRNMKNILYVLFAAVLLLAGCNQTKPTPDTTLIGVASSNRLLELSQVVLNSAGALDTQTVSIGSYIGSPVSYEIQISADSVSGATAGNALLQHSLAPTGSDWYTISTTVINGTSTRARLTGDILGGRLQLYILAPDTTTQVTNIRVDANLAASQPTQ